MRNKPLKKQLAAQFYSRNIPVFCIAVFTALFSGALGLSISWIMQQLIDAASGVPGALPIGTLAKISGAFVLLYMTAYLLDYVSHPRYIERAMRQYKDFAFQKLTEKKISSFRDESTAVYLSALTNDAVSIEENYLEKQLSLITQTLMFIGALAMMLWYSPLMTAIAVGVTIFPLAASLLTGNRLQAAEKRVSDRNRDFTAALHDCLSGFAVVKSFKAEKEIFKLFAESNRALEGEKFGRRRIKTIVGMIGAIAGIFAQLGVFLIGAYLALSGYGLTSGVVILFVNLMNFIIQPIAELPGLLAARRAALGLIDRLASELEKNSSDCGGEELSALEHEIRLENVSFGYGEEKKVLHELNAVFEAGKAYAVVGGSGSGKSTLLHLLTGGSTDYTGNILLDGTELRRIAPESLYDMISVVLQNVFVFNASVKDNVSMFHDFPQEEIDEAMRRARLTGLITERGDSCLCGEGGRGLSGGEKQRISIARSLLKKSSVLLADEITAALDAQTAHQVTSDILDLKGMTRIIVTHTLEESLLRRYDGIFVLKDGRIAEKGGFDELMQRKGYFYALFTVSQ
ncbi:MAG: ABC transporter ATP-binding protein [Clostridiales bacterium]|nr:ABC transporter ATP-binding protein [Clostridiales bacterium]